MGPCQLTWPAWQDDADRLGGGWLPGVNCLVGFRGFAGLLAKYPAEEAYSRWNTGGPGPTEYADRALASLPQWQRLISPPT